MITASQQIDRVSDSLTRLAQSRQVSDRDIKTLVVRLDRVANTLDQQRGRQSQKVQAAPSENDPFRSYDEELADYIGRVERPGGHRRKELDWFDPVGGVGNLPQPGIDPKKSGWRLKRRGPLGFESEGAPRSPVTYSRLSGVVSRLKELGVDPNDVTIDLIMGNSTLDRRHAQEHIDQIKKALSTGRL